MALSRLPRIRITTTSPFVDFAAEGIAAMLMAGIVNAAGKNGQVKPAIAIVATFLTTFVSGVIFMVIKMAMLGGSASSPPPCCPSSP